MRAWMLILLPALLISGCSTVSPSLIGRWELVRLNNSKPSVDDQDTVWIFTKKNLTIIARGHIYKGSYRTFPEGRPAHLVMDLNPPRKGGTAIYRKKKKNIQIKVSEQKHSFSEDFSLEQGYDLLEFRKEMSDNK